MATSTTNEVFKKMVDWVYLNGMASNQAELCEKIGLDPASVSRILNGRVKGCKGETLRKVNAAFGNIFNPEWIRGESNVMLVRDLTPTGMNACVETRSMVPDMSSMINAVIAGKDDAIMALKRELASKEETIAALRGQIDDKEALIRDKERYIGSLQQQLADLQRERGSRSGFPYVPGVAETDTDKMSARR